MIRHARPSDYRRIYDQDPPVSWYGMTDGTSIGFLSHDDWGRAWAFLSICGPFSAVGLHRTAKRFFEVVRQTGEPEVLAYCAPNETARRWLTRLGFEKHDEDEVGEIWRWQG
ncbi:MAG: hypothetical protein AAFR47_02265 [Pseudomonadota bacterium]